MIISIIKATQPHNYSTSNASKIRQKLATGKEETSTHQTHELRAKCYLNNSKNP